MTSGRSDLVDISVVLKHETAKAYLVDHGGREEVWIPKSQCEYDKSTKTLTLPEWLAKDKGML